MRRRQRAFTLLEVLIALAILAISATAVIRQTGNSLAQLSVLEAKTAAELLAESRIDQLMFSDEFPAVGSSSDVVTFNTRQWLVSTDVSDTSEPWLRKVEVRVSEPSDSDYALARLISYKGKY